MEIILLENINKLGAFGATVKVAKGYGRNYLIPQGKALPATASNIASFELRREELEKVILGRIQAAEARAAQFSDIALMIAAKTAEEGKLYGSVGVTDIVEALQDMNLSVERSEVTLPEGPIHSVGEYEIVISFHAEVERVIPVTVICEKDLEKAQEAQEADSIDDAPEAE